MVPQQDDRDDRATACAHRGAFTGGMTRRLTDEEIERQAGDLPDWTRDDDTIRASFEAPDFLGGIALVQEVAAAAETMDHHPDIDIRWRTVAFALSTHSEGGLTQARRRARAPDQPGGRAPGRDRDRLNTVGRLVDVGWASAGRRLDVVWTSAGRRPVDRPRP